MATRLKEGGHRLIIFSQVGGREDGRGATAEGRRPRGTGPAAGRCVMSLLPTPPFCCSTVRVCLSSSQCLSPTRRTCRGTMPAAGLLLLPNACVCLTAVSLTPHSDRLPPCSPPARWSCCCSFLAPCPAGSPCPRFPVYTSLPVQFTRTLDLLEEWLTGRGLGYLRIDGTVAGGARGRQAASCTRITALCPYNNALRTVDRQPLFAAAST